jgi:hypothetical protein
MIKAKKARNLTFRNDDPDVVFEADAEGFVCREGGTPLTSEEEEELLGTGLFTRVKGEATPPPTPERDLEPPEEPEEPEEPEGDPEDPEGDPEDPTGDPDEDSDGDAETGDLPVVLDVEMVQSRVNDYKKGQVRAALHHFGLEYDAGDLKDELVEKLAAHLTNQELLDEAIGVMESA